MLGMTDNKVEDVKIIGTREMNMNANMKNIFDTEDAPFDIPKPYFNDAQFNWETFNTPKIKTVFFEPSHSTFTWMYMDFGTIIRIKCYDKIGRMERTSDDEKCANWDMVDSFGVQLDKQKHFEPEVDYWNEFDQILNDYYGLFSNSQNIQEVEVSSDYRIFYDPADSAHQSLCSEWIGFNCSTPGRAAS